MEQMDCNLLFRRFVGLGIDDAIRLSTVFAKNRDRLPSTDMSCRIMAAILAHREVVPLLSDESFSVDGTLVKAWASMKSFQPKDHHALSQRGRRTGRSARYPHVAIAKSIITVFFSPCLAANPAIIFAKMKYSPRTGPPC